MSNRYLVFTSIFFTLFILELFFRLILFDKNHYDYKKRYLLYSGEEVFRNIDNFFTYYPNKKINAVNYYFKNEKFIEVYNYNIYTNNYGLPQKNDIDENKKSILFLGDSFTEGQGYESWIDTFDGNYKDYQIINGGFLGTGFQQFELIDNYLSNFDISKVFLIYLGDDLRRDIFQFNNQQLNCLNDYNLCLGNESFYGSPSNKEDIIKFLLKLNHYQKTAELDEKFTLKKMRRSVKSFFLELYIVKIPLEFLRSTFYKSKNDKIRRNFLAIDRLIEKYGKNIFFINLKMKQEILNKKKSYETIYLEKFLRKKSKNFFYCDFNNDLDNFYIYDMHPNKKGYKYLASCIEKILKDNIDGNY